MQDTSSKLEIENKFKMKLSFDKHGYLFPYDVVEIDLTILKTNFVDAFPNSQTRRWLLNNYLEYIYRFQDEVFPFFEQWINGSFITQKQNPKDIDLVTFLDFEVYEKRGDKRLDKFWAFSLEDKQIDAYLVKEYPKHHVDYKKYLRQKEIWKKRYGTSRPDKNDNIYNKGFVKIIFEK